MTNGAPEFEPPNVGVRFDLPFPLLADDRCWPTTVAGRRPLLADAENPEDRPPVDDLLGVVDDIREPFVFDCTLVEC